MTEIIKFTMRELQKIRSGLLEKETELGTSLKKIGEVKAMINTIIARHGVDQNDAVIILPKNIFQRLAVPESINCRFNWKKVACETIEDFDGFLSTDQLFERAKLKYPVELVDRRKSVQNFSSALYYLCDEGKIGRFRGKKNVFYYGLALKHFDISGKPNQKYIKQLDN